jgi:hypothetical protein
MSVAAKNGGEDIQIDHACGRVTHPEMTLNNDTDIMFLSNLDKRTISLVLL